MKEKKWRPELPKRWEKTECFFQHLFCYILSEISNKDMEARRLSLRSRRIRPLDFDLLKIQEGQTVAIDVINAA
jgi:hypothetical protein